MILAVCSLQSCRKQDFLKHRWVYVASTLRSDAHVEEIRQIVGRASQNGLNGMVLSARLDQLAYQDDAYFRRLAQVREICEQNGIEIIPKIFSAGYGSAMLFENRNLAAGLPVRDLRYAVRNQRATLIQDKKLGIEDSGFEAQELHGLSKSRQIDQPGELSFLDRNIKKSGRQAVRFQNFSRNAHGNARIVQRLAIQQARHYTISIWLKTEDLHPAGNFAFQVHGADGRILRTHSPAPPATTDWYRLSFDFNSLGNESVTLYAGIWGGKAGRFWLDDLALTEVGLANVLHRPGTPVTVRRAGDGRVFQAGQDYAPIEDPQFDFASSHQGPPISILASGAIRNGDTLLVSYYHGLEVRDGQVSLCLSEPELYKSWRERARLILSHLNPQKFLLSMDEIRQGGACRACKSRGSSMARILGDCISRQRKILRELVEDAEVFVWSDMFDPNHNASSNYFQVDGDFTGSWDAISRDITMVCWHFAKRNQSLSHFSGLGFRTMAAAYYDAENLDDAEAWLRSLADTKGAVGIMYTTWQNKYRLLEPFGALVKKSMAPGGDQSSKDQF